jgi:hypothetical protein
VAQASTHRHLVRIGVEFLNCHGVIAAEFVYAEEQHMIRLKEVVMKYVEDFALKLGRFTENIVVFCIGFLLRYTVAIVMWSCVLVESC